MSFQFKQTPALLQTTLLFLAVLLLYAGSLSAPFVFDDLGFFDPPDAINRYGHNFFNFDLRWLPYSSLSWTVMWFGLDLFWLRIGNVLLHAANAIALFFLLRHLFRLTLVEDDTQDRLPASLTWFAFFGALLFALHPVAVYGVAYLIQRTILMATLFMLLMLLAYLEGLRRNSWRWMLAAALCYSAAVYAKEHSIMAPAVALALTLLVRKPSLDLLKLVAPYFILSALIATTVLLSIKGVLGESYEPNGMGMLNFSANSQGLKELPDIHWLSILTQSWLFFKYLGLWLLPNPAWMSVDMREPFALSFFSWPQTLGFVMFLAYPCIALWLLLKRGRTGLLGFAMLFPWLLFLTEWSVIRIQEPFVLYRSYLWMTGLFAALPFALGWLAPNRAYLLMGFTCLLLVPLALNRINTFSSALLLWDDAEKLIRNKPNITAAERTYYSRGSELARLGRYTEAIADFDRAIAAYPGFDFVYGDRGTAYYSLGKYHEALRDYNRAIALNDKNPISYFGRALTYRALGDFKSAQEDFNKSCSLGICP